MALVGHLLAAGKCGDALRTGKHVIAHKTACPTSLMGQTQVLLAKAAWVEIPLLSYRIGTPPRLFTHAIAGLSQSNKSAQPASGKRQELEATPLGAQLGIVWHVVLAQSNIKHGYATLMLGQARNNRSWQLN